MALMRMSALYLDSHTNRVNLSQLRDSFEAFQIYFSTLLRDRDKVLQLVLKQLDEGGISIN